MARKALRNYCFVPTTDECMCVLRRGCGGIKVMSDACPEHGTDAAVPVLMNTHFHAIQGQAVGT